MQFADYLKTIVAGHGNEFAGTPAAVDELQRMGAFAGMPALANVYRQAVASHAARKFIALGAWDGEARRLVDRFAVHTGLMPDLVEFVFRALGYAVGMDLPAPEPAGYATCEQAADRACEPQEAYGDSHDASQEHAPVTNPAWRVYAGPEQKRAYIEALTEVDREREPMVGVAVSDPHCTEVGDRSVTLTFELRRTEPRATAMLNYALYDMKGRITGIGMAAAVTVESAGRTPCALRLVCRPERLSRILLYFI